MFDKIREIKENDKIQKFILTFGYIVLIPMVVFYIESEFNLSILGGLVAQIVANVVLIASVLVAISIIFVNFKNWYGVLFLVPFIGAGIPGCIFWIIHFAYETGGA